MYVEPSLLGEINGRKKFINYENRPYFSTFYQPSISRLWKKNFLYFLSCCDPENCHALSKMMTGLLTQILIKIFFWESLFRMTIFFPAAAAQSKWLIMPKIRLDWANSFTKYGWLSFWLGQKGVLFKRDLRLIFVGTVLACVAHSQSKQNIKWFQPI